VFCILASVIYAVGSTRISGRAGVEINLKHYLSGDLAETMIPIQVDNQLWTYGTAANAVNVIYADTATLADGANTTLDLYASGSLLDIFKQSLTMEALKFLYIKNNSSDATLKVGGGASNDLDIFADTSDIALIKPGGVFLWADPSAAGLDLTTNKNLKLEHDGTGSSTMDVDVVAMGLD
jgi:hypothetical protein